MYYFLTTKSSGLMQLLFLEYFILFQAKSDGQKFQQNGKMKSNGIIEQANFSRPSIRPIVDGDFLLYLGYLQSVVMLKM